LKRFWKRLTDAPISGVDDVVKYYDKTKQIQSSISQLTVEFCELGIAEPEKDIELLYYSIEQFIREEWEILETLSTKQKSFLTSSHQLLNACISQLDRLLVLQDTSVVLKILDQVEHHFSSLLLHQSQLSLLPQSIHSALGFAQDFNHLQAVIANSHWTKFQKHFPSFSSFDMQNLHQKAEAVISSREKEFKAFARYILHSVSKEFKYYHELLSTPAQKLNARDKALKKRLRKGKSLLVKEFSKTRSHPSIRNLMQSEAREWIQLLTPIWLSNPTQLSKIFPLEKGLFHVAIFDEASQIILQHGLGALQRSEHAIIAGDSKQMGPSSYFQAKGEHTRDLLHQASFYWNTCFLSHHYRSLHPDLIAFSNKVFYDNQLITYQASNIEQPVRLHYVKNAVYIERKNLKEAKVVADYVTQLMKTDEHIGVVAFSEEQLDTIINALTIKTRMELLERVDAGHAFFKTLENVQGDECDHLVISFGYGYNEEQQFAMRFGPMNTENGQRRLNVLLTRARKRLDFFASVQHSDFKLSENESINTLRQWFAFAESLKTESNSLQLPFEGRTEREGNRLTLFEPHRIHPDALSFLTFQEVMESRGWQLNYA
jgi:hypothetical protein